MVARVAPSDLFYYLPMAPKSYKSVNQLPHTPGPLTAATLATAANGLRAKVAGGATVGSVVGQDPVTGEQLILQPGGKVIRASVPEATPGNEVTLQPSTGGRSRRGTRATTTSVATNTPTTVTAGGGNPSAPKTLGALLASSNGNPATPQLWEAFTDPCTPPLERLSIAAFLRNRNVYVTSESTYTQLFGVAYGAGSQDIQAANLYLGELQKQLKKAPPTLGVVASSTATTITPSAQALWECTPTGCRQSAVGVYATKEQCEAQCAPKSWDCVAGSCLERAGLGGAFSSLGECLASGCSTRYRCVGGDIVPDKNGPFATPEAARAGGCYWGYNLSDGECSPALGGFYKSLACCRSAVSQRLSYGTRPDVLYEGTWTLKTGDGETHSGLLQRAEGVTQFPGFVVVSFETATEPFRQLRLTIDGVTNVLFSREPGPPNDSQGPYLIQPGSPRVLIQRLDRAIDPEIFNPQAEFGNVVQGPPYEYERVPEVQEQLFRVRESAFRGQFEDGSLFRVGGAAVPYELLGAQGVPPGETVTIAGPLRFIQKVGESGQPALFHGPDPGNLTATFLRPTIGFKRVDGLSDDLPLNQTDLD